jgi:hypothetical protein
VVGFAYKIGVKNNKNVILTESRLPKSRSTPFKREKIKPRPNVMRMIGMIRRGRSIIAALGTNLYQKSRTETKQN